MRGDNREGQKFCGECGAALVTHPAPPSNAGPVISLGGLRTSGRLRSQLGQVSAQQRVGDLPVAPAVLFDQTGVA